VGGRIPMSALDEQIGGNHYKNFEIQPIEFIMKNRLSFLQGSVIKRICRYNTPTGGGFKDLEKIKHEIDLLIELDGWKEKESKGSPGLFKPLEPENVEI
jgi:hypothetical protein